MPARGDCAAQVAPPAADSDIGLIYPPRPGLPIGYLLVLPNLPVQLKGIFLDPPIDCGVIDRHAPFGHHPLEIAVAHTVTTVPPHRPQNDLSRKITTREDAHCPNYFTSIFLLPQFCNSARMSTHGIREGEEQPAESFQTWFRLQVTSAHQNYSGPFWSSSISAIAFSTCARVFAPTPCLEIRPLNRIHHVWSSSSAKGTQIKRSCFLPRQGRGISSPTRSLRYVPEEDEACRSSTAPLAMPPPRLLTRIRYRLFSKSISSIRVPHP